MRDPHTIIVRPLLTEKNVIAKDKRRCLTFRVVRDANKIEIARAVEAVFHTKVEGVRVLNVEGKIKRMGRFEGRRPSWKKAYVTLRKGEKPIEYFEGL